jgi:hypothetical protein|tara:strand:- start:58 stop:267 length:210 start_codon:yes stop_codon:yes gene_type:complete
MYAILIKLKSSEGYIGVDDLYTTNGKASFADIEDKSRAVKIYNALKVIYPDTDFVLMKTVSPEDDDIPF